MQRLLETGRWWTREAVDEAIYEKKAASGGNYQVIMHRAEKIAEQVAIKVELSEQCIQDLLVRPAPPAPPRVDGT